MKETRVWFACCIAACFLIAFVVVGPLLADGPTWVDGGGDLYSTKLCGSVVDSNCSGIGATQCAAITDATWQCSGVTQQKANLHWGRLLGYCSDSTTVQACVIYINPQCSILTLYFDAACQTPLCDIVITEPFGPWCTNPTAGAGGGGE